MIAPIHGLVSTCHANPSLAGGPRDPAKIYGIDDATPIRVCPRLERFGAKWGP